MNKFLKITFFIATILFSLAVCFAALTLAIGGVYKAGTPDILGSRTIGDIFSVLCQFIYLLPIPCFIAGIVLAARKKYKYGIWSNLFPAAYSAIYVIILLILTD